MKDIKISIEEQSTIFKKHLNQEDNERIIFSAAFGAGKTYFLKEFFDTGAEEYLTVKLAPVNYSIASNEDIFKLIKFDILFELLAHHGAKEPGKIKIRSDIFWSLKLAEKADGFFTSIATFLGALNKDVKDATEVITALAVIHSQVSEFVDTSTEIQENPEISGFLKKMMESYVHEADDITTFIETVLTQLSRNPDKKKKDRKKVLVIDDLDRLDPEHIFRLFNVFSAHFDYNQSNRNKFGFDKVIFVCDIQNVRNIFQSRYGSNTDFSGYIDKFFSQEVFHFNNGNAIKKSINHLLKSIQLENSNDFIEDYFEKHVLQGSNRIEKGLSFWILFELVVSGALKPRRIYSPQKAWAFPDSTITVEAQYGLNEVHINCVPAIVNIQLLSSILGGGEQLLQAVKHASGQPRSIEYRNLLVEKANYGERLLGSLLILDYHAHRFQTYTENHHGMIEHHYTHPDERTIDYLIGVDSGRRELYSSSIRKNTNKVQFFELLPVMIEKLLKNGIIR